MGKIAQFLSRFASAINPPMYRAWYYDKHGERAYTKWCKTQEELDQVIGTLPEGTQMIGTQTDQYGEIH